MARSPSSSTLLNSCADTTYVFGIPVVGTVRSLITGTPPHLFLNNYEMLSVLGEGSFGEAVLAYRLAAGALSFSEFVALKCFSKSRLSKKRDIRKMGGRMAVTTALDKVGVELRVLAALAAAGGSPYVARLREVLNDPTSDELYFVLDYCDGGDLMTYDAEDDCFRSRFTEGPLTLAQCRQVMHDLALALRFCHALGVAHRDVKPDNLLLTSAGRCVLSDFGVARQFSLGGGGDGGRDSAHSSPEKAVPVVAATLEGAPPGKLEPPTATNGGGGSPTPADWVRDTAGSYMFLCPEAAAGEGYSAFSADLWAAGVTLYILLFGVAPFGRGCRDPEALFEAIRTQPLGVLPWDRALKVGGDLYTAPLSAPRDGLGRDEGTPAGGSARPSFSYGGGGSAQAEVTDLLRRLLAKDPERRMRTAEELLAHPFLHVVYDVAGEDAAAGVGAGDGAVQQAPPLLLRRESIPPIDVSRLQPYVTPEMAMHGVVEEPADAGGGAGGAGIVIVREGWLLKQGQKRKSWKRRFFRLTADGMLRYYSEKPASGGGGGGGGGGDGGGALKALSAWVRAMAGAGTGEGSLQLSSESTMVRSPKPGMPWRIVLGTKELYPELVLESHNLVNYRLLKLQAENEADADAWDRALRVFTSSAAAAAAFLKEAEID